MSSAIRGYVPVCTTDEVPESAAVRVMVEGRPVAVVRSEGQFFAIYDVCSHANVNLSEGEVEDTTIECWLHGSRFDLTTGRPTGLPAVKPVPVYPVKVDGDQVLVSLDRHLDTGDTHDTDEES